LDRNLSAFTTLFALGKSWDNVRTTTAPYTESRLAHLVRNKCVGFPVVEHLSYLNLELLVIKSMGLEFGSGTGFKLNPLLLYYPILMAVS
jgi:hypothetical protein